MKLRSWIISLTLCGFIAPAIIALVGCSEGPKAPPPPPADTAKGMEQYQKK